MSRPVLLVHGAWHGAWCWEQHWVDHLTEAGYEVTAIDLPGHDRPGTRGRIWHSLGSYASAVGAALGKLGPETVVVGHSMGGLVTQLAVAGRTDVRGMALVASVPPNGVLGATLRKLREETSATIRTIATLNMWPLVSTPQLVRGGFFGDTTPEETITTVLEQLQNESYRAYVEMLVRRAKPDQISAAVFVMAAERDGIFTLDEQDALAAAYGVDAHVVPGSGHDVMLDTQWENAARDLVAWMETL